MIAIALLPPKRRWRTLSFSSTLYLWPVLELLLAEVPSPWQPELRLGLQEALVNAAKHGNGLDPSKTVVVHFAISPRGYSWIICDQGVGFCPRTSQEMPELPPEEAECGRGLCLLYHIFDQVAWNDGGRELHLEKYIKGDTAPEPLLV